MRLTKKKALQITADLWGWLEDNPKKEKEEWPEWEFNGGNIAVMLDDCACCEYAQFECNRCPLIKLWREKSSGGDPCMGEGYFNTWGDAKTPKTKKKYARIIKEGALKAMEDLKR